MREFNYARAWRETAKPLFEALPDNVRKLLDRVTKEGFGQERGTLDCIWPKLTDDDRWFRIATENDWSGDLKESFEAIDSDLLSRSAAIIHKYGHWMPGGVSDREKHYQTWWYFSHYADQILRVRLKRDGCVAGASATWMSPKPHAGSNGPNYGPSLAIHEGVIRVGYSTSDGWTWKEVAFATEANIDLLRDCYAAIPRADDDKNPFSAIGSYNTMAWCERMRDRFLHDDGSPLSNLVRAGEKFMEEKVIKCNECGQTRPINPDKFSEKYDAIYESEA